MCHNPRTAQAMWAIQRGELLTEAVEARRVKVDRGPCGSSPLVAVGLRRLGAMLISVGTRLQGTTSVSTVSTSLSTLDPSP